MGRIKNYRDLIKENDNKLADRYNEGKLKYSLLNLKIIEPGIGALEYGAKKYSPHGYEKGFKLSTIVDSLMRHLADLTAGIKVDKESGVSTIGCIQANAFFLGIANNIDDLPNTNEE